MSKEYMSEEIYYVVQGNGAFNMVSRTKSQSEEGGLANVSEHNLIKMFICYLISKHFPSESHQILISNSGCLTMRTTPTIPHNVHLVLFLLRLLTAKMTCCVF